MKSKVIIFLLALSLVIPFAFTKAATPNNLNGKILLQVESKGEAWYVNPKDSKRYYMANGDQAFQIMKTLGVGMSNKDVEKMKTDATYRKKFIGKILLQVESKGEAYYISSDGRYNYLKDGASAYQVMRKLGLGISNANLGKIAEYNTNSKTNIISKNNNIISSTSTLGVLHNTCSTDDCYERMAVVKNDSSVCYNIKDHKKQGFCLVSVYFNLNKSDNHPCDVFKSDYPELEDAKCKELEAVINTMDRDGATLIDLGEIIKHLKEYYDINNKYPSNVAPGDKLGSDNWIVPNAIKGRTSNCMTNYEYNYSSIGKDDYSLSYCIDGNTEFSLKYKLISGTLTFSPKGSSTLLRQTTN